MRAAIFFLSVCLSLTGCSAPTGEAPPAADTMAAEQVDTAASTETAEPEAMPEEKPLSYYQDKVAEIKTDAGTIAIRFFPDVAPNHVRNFIDLAEQDFYDGTKFHRIVPGFVIQGGDPNSKSGPPATWGTGGSGRNLKAEFNSIHHSRGIISMARSSDPDSASSQFFVVVAEAPHLDNQYTAFGQVVSGMDVADKIVNAERTGQSPVNPVAIQDVVIRDATAGEKGPAPVG